MEQRQVRLGDVLDDYCTRERRVTNHAVVALVGNEVKLTRCTTCDTEHPYKAARVPPRRQTKLVAALSSANADRPAPALQGPIAKADVEAAAETETPMVASADAPPPEATESPIRLRIDSVQRPLIRATLARPEGTPPPARQAPVFTIRENNGRDGAADRGGRQGRKGRSGGRPGAEPNGNRIDGYQGQSARPNHGKNVAKSHRSRGAGSRPDRSDRPDRANRSQPRSRGKGRSR